MSTRPVHPAHLALVAVILLLVVVFLSPARLLAQPADPAPLPAELQKGLEGAMKTRVEALRAEKDAGGQIWKRGFYSRSFRRVDDATYKAGLYVNSALADTMVVERYEATLTRGADSAWTVSNEILQDSWEGLHRGVLGDEDCSSFDSFSFAREGLTVTAGKGSVCRDYYMGQTSRFSFAATDLAYTYEPPVPREKMLHGIFQKEHAGDIIFTPEYAHVECDAVSCKEFLSQSFTGLAPQTREASATVLQQTYEEGMKSAQKGLKENPFWAFRLPNPPERRTWSLSIKKKSASDHWFRLSYDTFDPKEIAVYLSGYQAPIYLYYSEQTRKSGIAPYDLERRPDAEARDYDLRGLRGTVELGIGPLPADQEILKGDITYTLLAKRPLREITFGISRLQSADEKAERKNPTLTINTLQDSSGKDLTWVRTSLYTGLVILPDELPAGASMTLRLQFENSGSIYRFTPTYAFMDRGGWLPFVRFADLIHEFDLTVKAPAKYKTLGIGKMVSSKTEGGINITRWISESPVSFPTIIFGDYIEVASSFPAKKLDGTPIPVTVHVDKGSMGEWGTTPKSLQKFADDAANALNLFAAVFGVDYPYSKLDLVNDPAPIMYGQAPSSLIYLSSPTFIGQGRLASMTTGDSDRLTEFSNSLVAHETAHQWWGSLVANSNMGNYWFVESLAEYAAALFMENRYDRKHYQMKVDRWRDEILASDMRGTVQDNYTTWQGPGGFAPYRAAIYAKGPYAFHIMRTTFGDEKFFAFLKALTKELRGKEVVTRDIQRVAEQSFQMKMDWFFDQWLRGTGLPQFTFNYTSRQAEDGKYIIEGEILQKVLLRPQAIDAKEVLEGLYFEGVVPIYVTTKDGKEMIKKEIVKGPRTAFRFTVDKQPKEIVLNKRGELLGYDVKVNPSSM